MLGVGVLLPDESGIFRCETCTFTTVRKHNLRKHILSSKHMVSIESQIPSAVPATVLSDVMSMFKDQIGMIFKHQETTQQQNTEMMKALLADRQSVVLAQQPLVMETNTTTNTNNSFNLQFFLNEECKNAMNFSDFINTISVTLEDIQHIGEVGYTAGMSKIITKAMRDTKSRPLHCSDAKRETIYVKENDEWHRDLDCEETSRLIRNIVSKNYKALAEWRATLPEQLIHDTPEYEAWYSMSRNMCNTDPAALKKLIRHLATITAIEKN